MSATDPVFSVSSTAARTSEAISAGYRLEQPSPLALQCSVDSILSVEPGGSVRYIWTIGWTRQVEGGRLLFHGGASPELSAKRDLASANTGRKMQPERAQTRPRGVFCIAMTPLARCTAYTPHAPPPACLSPITTQVTTHSPRASKRPFPRARGVQRRQSSCKRPIHGAR